MPPPPPTAPADHRDDGDRRTEHVYLVCGASGRIGSQLLRVLQQVGRQVHTTSVRLENRDRILRVIDRYKPTLVFNCAGVSERSDSEADKHAVLRTNVLGVVNLADCCAIRRLHLTNFASCSAHHCEEGHACGVGFDGSEIPSCGAFHHSHCQQITESLLKHYKNVLHLRLRMPVSDTFDPQSILAQLANSEVIANIPVSQSILHELLPAAVKMAENGITGTFNFTNPGVIAPKAVFALYKKYIDPSFAEPVFIQPDETTVQRSNPTVSCGKLAAVLSNLSVTLLEVHEAYERCFKRISEQLAVELQRKASLKIVDPEDFNRWVSQDVGKRIDVVLPGVKNILVTGGAGFIGSYLVRKLVLLYPEFRVFSLDRLDYSASPRNTECLDGLPNYTFIKGDITSAGFLSSVFKNEKIDTVIHFAAHTHVDNSFGNSTEFTMNNVLGTHLLLETSRVHGIRRLIHISTDEVYGEVHYGATEVCEESILAPTNPYAATKAAAEMIVLAYYASFNVPAIITRSNNVYGPYQFPEKVIPKFINLLASGKKCCLHGDGSNLRRYIYASDVADAVDVILHKGRLGETYNIGSQFEISNRRLAEMLVEEMEQAAGNPEDHIEHVADRPYNDRRYAIDSSKLEQLGWKAKVPFGEGIRRTIKWYTKYGLTWWGDVSGALVPHPAEIAVGSRSTDE